MSRTVSLGYLWSDATFRLSQETLQRPFEFTGKLVEHQAQSPVRKFLILWPSIAEGFPTVRPRVKFMQKVSEESLS